MTCSRNKGGTPIAAKFPLLSWFDEPTHRFSAAVALTESPGGAGWLADQSQVPPEQPVAVVVSLGGRALQAFLELRGQPRTGREVIGAGQVLDVRQGPAHGRADHQPDLLRPTQDGRRSALALTDAALQKIELMPAVQGSPRAIGY